jgi:NADH-quinone oxidoreductase subunit F
MTTLSDLRAQALAEWQALEQGNRPRVLIGAATCGQAAGAMETMAAFQAQQAKHGLDINIISVGCIGVCYLEPVVTISKPGMPAIWYGDVDAIAAARLTERWLLGDDPCADLAIGALAEDGRGVDGIPPLMAHPMLGTPRFVLRNCGLIDPTNLNHYLARGGYQGLEKALSLTPQQVIDEVKLSGLRGRGGAGFPTAVKWQICRDQPSAVKYLICNADEGDPGAFMNRSLIEGDPHSLLEGLLVGGYALGAAEGYIYIRAEYPLAVERLKLALGQLREIGLLGKSILGSDFSFDIHIREGAGAFVCGEETALMASIEGKRGMPRPRPPFPATSGLWGKPTVINNVETLATAAAILRVGGAHYARQYGTERSKGTKTFALAGKVKNTGLIEVALGTPLRHVVFNIGGGILDDKQIKAVQTGGPSGGCIPADRLDTPVDYESLTAAGTIMGSGGMIVMDEDTCMVDVAHYFLSFTQQESCGKCPPCRVGTRQMLQILERIQSGEGELEDLDRLEKLAQTVKAGSLCALGQTAPNPVLTTLRYFRDEYIAHIVEQRCPAASCRMLVRAACVSACPAGVDVPAYLALVAQGRYAEALAVHREANPFAMICGRVCPAFCEQKCRRAQADEAVAIRQVKRFMADQLYAEPWTPPRLAPDKATKVAIVGAGPCGLTAALRLAQQGYQVTVFERMPQPGGMMTYGIPAYRLPREPLFAEIDHIRRAGVDIRCGLALGSDFTIDSLKADGYQAIVVALGAHQSRSLGIEGENNVGVVHGIHMLRDIALGQPPDLSGKRVVVVGGGDTAIDAARSAWRLGAKEVHVVYRREKKDMPAIKEEITAAEEEGVQFHFLVTPVAALGDGALVGVRLQRQSLGDYDSSGRRRPVSIPGSEFDMACDVLVPAIGQVTSVDDESLAMHGKTAFKVGKSFETEIPGVFAAGDAVGGPATVVQAIAHGNQVAAAVDVWLTSGQLGGVMYQPKRHDIPQLFSFEEYAEVHRSTPQVLSPEERLARRDFSEVEMTFDEWTVREECKRCQRCDLEWLALTHKPTLVSGA